MANMNTLLLGLGSVHISLGSRFSRIFFSLAFFRYYRVYHCGICICSCRFRRWYISRLCRLRRWYISRLCRFRRWYIPRLCRFYIGRVSRVCRNSRMICRQSRKYWLACWFSSRWASWWSLRMVLFLIL